mmetsp:Transcript_26997/g.68045  ORF Transcript_26997/g.68045 Transcript_26997/m.68045 type:complete len:269 (+) Transcript_26997:2207-3013(+)
MSSARGLRHWSSTISERQTSKSLARPKRWTSIISKGSATTSLKRFKRIRSGARRRRRRHTRVTKRVSSPISRKKRTRQSVSTKENLKLGVHWRRKLMHTREPRNSRSSTNWLKSTNVRESEMQSISSGRPKNLDRAVRMRGKQSLKDGKLNTMSTVILNLQWRICIRVLSFRKCRSRSSSLSILEQTRTRTRKELTSNQSRLGLRSEGLRARSETRCSYMGSRLSRWKLRRSRDAMRLSSIWCWVGQARLTEKSLAVAITSPTSRQQN